MTRWHLLTLSVGILIGYTVGLRQTDPWQKSDAEPISPIAAVPPRSHAPEPSPIAESGSVREFPGSPPETAVPPSQLGVAEIEAGNRKRPRRLSSNQSIAKAQISQLETVPEITAFLDEVRHINFFEEIRKAKPFTGTEESISQLHGRFFGEVQFLNSPDKHWEMELNADLNIGGKKLKGNTRILLSENGQVFSRLNGNGDLDKEFQRAPDGLGIVVKASPDTYFHLFYVPRRDVFIGNYYHEESPGNIVPKGTVHLDRS